MGWKQRYQANLFDELIIDNFAGGGGASTGIELATGRSVDIAINHDPAAIAMHKTNHPHTEHYCESVWEVDPRKATKGRPVGLLWLSPDCTHFSKAKGGKPVSKKVRGLAWIALRWAATVRPRVIMLENVEEFQDWGPITKEGQPDEAQKGRTFATFVNALRRQGYKVEWNQLRACDYGAPTIRKRLFMIARRDGMPIVWPEPTHGDPNSTEVKSGKSKPWLSSGEHVIDWSLPVPSIFDRKKPLVENTLRRIARGLKKFVIESPNPYIAPINKEVNNNGHLVASFLASYYTETSENEVRGLSLHEPLHTITSGGNRFALVSAFLVQQYKNSIGQSLDQPLWTTTSVNKANLVYAFLIKYYGSDVGQALNDPIHTIVTKDRFGLVTIHGQDYQIVDIGMRMLQPRELFNGQYFPADYIIDRDHEGNKYPKTQQIAKCGNSVSPVIPKHLVRANTPELCVDTVKTAVGVGC